MWKWNARAHFCLRGIASSTSETGFRLVINKRAKIVLRRFPLKSCCLPNLLLLHMKRKEIAPEGVAQPVFDTAKPNPTFHLMWVCARKRGVLHWSSCVCVCVEMANLHNSIGAACIILWTRNLAMFTTWSCSLSGVSELFKLWASALPTGYVRTAKLHPVARRNEHQLRIINAWWRIFGFRSRSGGGNTNWMQGLAVQ